MGHNEKIQKNLGFPLVSVFYGPIFKCNISFAAMWAAQLATSIVFKER